MSRMRTSVSMSLEMLGGDKLSDAKWKKLSSTSRFEYEAYALGLAYGHGLQSYLDGDATFTGTFVMTQARIVQQQQRQVRPYLEIEGIYHLDADMTRTQLIDMVRGIFDHYWMAGDDNFKLKGIEFPQDATTSSSSSSSKRSRSKSRTSTRTRTHPQRIVRPERDFPVGHCSYPCPEGDMNASCVQARTACAKRDDEEREVILAEDARIARLDEEQYQKELVEYESHDSNVRRRSARLATIVRGGAVKPDTSIFQTFAEDVRATLYASSFSSLGNGDWMSDRGILKVMCLIDLDERTTSKHAKKKILELASFEIQDVCRYILDHINDMRTTATVQFERENSVENKPRIAELDRMMKQGIVSAHDENLLAFLKYQTDLYTHFCQLIQQLDLKKVEQMCKGEYRSNHGDNNHNSFLHNVFFSKKDKWKANLCDLWAIWFVHQVKSMTRLKDPSHYLYKSIYSRHWNNKFDALQLDDRMSVSFTSQLD